MKLLLYSSFEGIYKLSDNLISEMLNKPANKATCLFIFYADEESAEYIERNRNKVKQFAHTVIDLTRKTVLEKIPKIDMIFVNGGNNTELIFKLHRYKQFDYINDLIKQNVLYIGNSAGSVVCGNDFEDSLIYEPFDTNYEICKQPDFFKGFNLINKRILVHASKYRLSKSKGLIFDKESWSIFCKFKQPQRKFLHETIANNEVLQIVDEKITKHTYKWKDLVKEYEKQKI